MKIFWCCIVLSLISEFTIAQNDSLATNYDTLQKINEAQSLSNNKFNQKIYADTTRISFPSYFVLLGKDFKQAVTSPFHLTNKQLLPTGIYVGSIILLQSFSEYFDEPIQKLGVNIHNSSTSISSLSNNITQLGGRNELYCLAALGSYGFIFKNKKLQTTTLLATQAYLTSGLIETLMKTVSGRQRPSYYNPAHPESEPTFHGPVFKKGLDVGGPAYSSSFPSGHTTVIFAAATVFAKEYSNIKWVPIVAYSTASLIGISRITENKHWATDVIVGATLGYLSGNLVVNNYHRYVTKKEAQKRGTLSFTLNYNGVNLEPGLIYAFRK